MSRTDLDPATFARMLRRMAGDGSVEWVYEPIQARVLLDVADLLDENAKLRELVADMCPFVEGAMDDEYCPAPECPFTELCTENQVCMASSGFHYRMRELGVETDDE